MLSVAVLPTSALQHAYQAIWTKMKPSSRRVLNLIDGPMDCGP
jgi:hypothetical protein